MTDSRLTEGTFSATDVIVEPVVVVPLSLSSWLMLMRCLMLSVIDALLVY
jgi:hypothetical protein